jgi:hypothetical protein
VRKTDVMKMRSLLFVPSKELMNINTVTIRDKDEESFPQTKCPVVERWPLLLSL